MNVNESGSTGWRKSSFSGGNGGCVEVGWRTSSYSGGSGSCVEVAATEARVLLRDSKNPGGPTLSVSTGQWRELKQRLA